MSVEVNVSFIQTSLNKGENVVIKGKSGIGKTYLLEVLEENLKLDKKKIKFVSGIDSTSLLGQKNPEIEKMQKEIVELISNDKEVILLLDDLQTLYDSGFTLDYINPTNRIVATIQAFDDFDDLGKRSLHKYFDKVIDMDVYVNHVYVTR